jgi:hypothetical protein
MISNGNEIVNIKSGVNLTIDRMNKRSAVKIIRYFDLHFATGKAVSFCKKIKSEGLPRFEDIFGSSEIDLMTSGLEKKI